MNNLSIKEQRQKANDTNKLIDHLISLIDSNNARYSFEWSSDGVSGEMKIFDKEKKIGYILKLEQIEYDENGNAKNI